MRGGAKAKWSKGVVEWWNGQRAMGNTPALHYSITPFQFWFVATGSLAARPGISGIGGIWAGRTGMGGRSGA